MTVKTAEPKPATYHPDKRTLGELLATTNPPLVVPDWQRSYSWTTSNVETFWNDLVGFDDQHKNLDQQEYFLGSVVIVATSSSEHLLLDGQQRLATTAILLSVIREYLKRFKADAAERLQNKFLADFDDAKDELVYKLSLNAYDREFFRREILEKRDGSYKPPAAEHASHHTIREAREFFEKIFEEQYATAKTPEEAHRWAIKIQNILLNHMSVVAVTSSDEDSAAEVFETLNDRGIGLSTPDLLRNLIIRRAKDEIRPDIVELWGEIIQFETDTEIKAFLRHYWISRHGDVKTQRLYREIKGHVVKNGIDSLDFSRDLKDASVVYRDMIAARDDDPEISESLRALGELAAGIIYPIVLSAMERTQGEERRAILQAIVNVFVRHSVVGQLENSKLENVTHKIASELRDGLKPQDALTRLADFAPSDDAFTTAFQRLSLLRTASQRYLLRKLELDARRTEELDVNPPHKVHVEHIYPQTPEAQFRLANHGAIVNRLGNLSLLDKILNIQARNGRLCDKRPHYEGSDLLITMQLADVQGDDWTPQMVEDRQKKFADRAVTIWPLIRAA